MVMTSSSSKITLQIKSFATLYERKPRIIYGQIIFLFYVAKKVIVKNAGVIDISYNAVNFIPMIYHLRNVCP